MVKSRSSVFSLIGCDSPALRKNEYFPSSSFYIVGALISLEIKWLGSSSIEFLMPLSIVA